MVAESIRNGFRFRGREYKSLYDFVNVNGFPEEKAVELESMINNGHPLHPLLAKTMFEKDTVTERKKEEMQKNEEEKRMNEKFTTIPITVFGQNFNSIGEVQRKYDLTNYQRAAIGQAYKNGKDVDKLVEKFISEKKKNTKNQITVFGNTFQTVADAARFYGLTDGQRTWLNKLRNSQKKAEEYIMRCLEKRAENSDNTNRFDEEERREEKKTEEKSVSFIPKAHKNATLTISIDESIEKGLLDLSEEYGLTKEEIARQMIQFALEHTENS